MNQNTFPTGIDSKIMLEGPCGTLEALTTTPKDKQATALAIICHPHPQQEGTMNNKVVHTLSRAYHNQGIATVRFNYRGVGKSDGTFGDYDGEVADCIAVYDWVTQCMPEKTILISGFSFGSYIATAVACEKDCKHLITVAPSLKNKDFSTFIPRLSCPWLIIQGTEDEIIEPDLVYEFANTHHIPLQKLENAGHFFHSKLVELRKIAEESIAKLKL